jgi:pimeloyl-ACP methyl ester carboxylesterase
MLTLVDADNGTVFGEDVVLEVTTKGVGTPLLLLPGAERVQENNPFVDALSQHFSVTVPSHPGFGLSPRPDWCESVDDLAYLYLSWLKNINATDVVVVGLQFGGWVAAEMAVRDCSRMSRLVLVDPVGIKVGGVQDRDIADMFAMPRRELDSLLYSDPSAGLGDLALAPVKDVWELARNEEALALYGWEPYLHNPRLRRWLRRISCPTLVAWGADDGIVSPAYGLAYAESVPNAQFELLEGAGHRAQVERPDELAKLIAEFGV